MDFTAASDARDPEETRDLLQRYAAETRDVIERYGGTIEKFIGDAVMAVWGTPAAHEDDAERAIRAGLDLVAAVSHPGPASGASAAGQSLQLRVGVTTGEAAVAPHAVGEQLVAGDVVNTAARLQAAAEPGTVLADEATQRAASRAISFEPVGERELRGKALPVAAYRALRVVAGRGGQGRSEEIEPPFVGRDSELTLLKDLFHSVTRERRLHLVSITGQAGIGKGRLVWELEKYLDGIVETVFWHQGRSPAYGEGITFWALGEMIRRRAGLAEGEDEASTRQKLRAMLSERVASESERQQVEAKLLALLGVGELGSVDRGELFAAWRLLFERLAEAAPTVLVFEDLQWADDGLVDFIEHLLAWSRPHPILVVTLARPELLEQRPTWGAGQRNFTSLHLDPLADERMRALLAGLVPDLPRPAARAILAKAEGVPLYAVEMVRMLAADGTLTPHDDRYRLARPLGELAIPSTLQALIAARLDSLPSDGRALLQVASVLGQSFTLDALAAVAGADPAELKPRLDPLVSKELLRVEVDPRSPERGQYQFVQAVTRDVAYGTLARKERKERHLAAARHFESLGVDELAGALARHYLDAYHAASDGPERKALEAQARVALRGAADRAEALHANRQAMAFLELAVSVTSDPDEQAALRERAADAADRAGLLGDAIRLMEEVVARHRASGDATRTAGTIAKLGRFLTHDGKVDESRDLLAGALPELEGKAAEPELADLIDQLGRAHYLAADVDRGFELAGRALDIAERHGAAEVAIDALITRGSILFEARPIEGRALLMGAAEQARRLGSDHEIRALNNLGSLAVFFGPREVQAVEEAGLEAARRSGDRAPYQVFASSAAYTSFLLGEWDEAMARLDDLNDEEMPSRLVWSKASTRATIAAMCGQQELLREALAEAREQLAAITDPQYEPGQRLTEALIAIAQGRFRDAIADSAAISYPTQTVVGARYYGGLAALWLEDAATARKCADALDAIDVRAPLVEAYRVFLTAGIAALDGRHTDATAGFHEALRAQREMGNFVEVLLQQLTLVRLLGETDPDGRRAAAEAREAIDRLRAEPLRALLGPEAAEVAAAVAETPSERRVTSGTVGPG